MKIRIHYLSIGVAAGLALWTSAQAATIFVGEHSFEGAKPLSGWTGGGPAPGSSIGTVPTPWVKTGGGFGSNWTITSQYSGGIPDGDLTAAYQWSEDLSTFHADGGTDGDGTRVDFTDYPDTPTPGTTTVTATVTGAATANLFVRVRVTQD